jgi:hypothetical protein
MKSYSVYYVHFLSLTILLDSSKLLLFMTEKYSAKWINNHLSIRSRAHGQVSSFQPGATVDDTAVNACGPALVWT